MISTGYKKFFYIGIRTVLSTETHDQQAYSTRGSNEHVGGKLTPCLFWLLSAYYQHEKPLDH